ncbi:MAG TPA: hypothetical protein VHI93_07065 [Candidatus Thermoplasmatota archaeon]|nr:hypothetical protein [Candidatus Thermoplasmatota archaeon]
MQASSDGGDKSVLMQTDLAGFREVRDAVEARVRALLRARGIPIQEPGN